MQMMGKLISVDLASDQATPTPGGGAAAGRRRRRMRPTASSWRACRWHSLPTGIFGGSRDMTGEILKFGSYTVYPQVRFVSHWMRSASIPLCVGSVLNGIPSGTLGCGARSFLCLLSPIMAFDHPKVL